MSIQIIKSYSYLRDYYGFYPLKPRKQRQFWNKNIFSCQDIAWNIGKKSDILYFADMYGVYANDCTNKKAIVVPQPKIIGGITNSDYSLLKFMMDAKRTYYWLRVYSFVNPLNLFNRYRTEELLDIHPKWAGLVNILIALDSTNKELPRWISAPIRQ